MLLPSALPCESRQPSRPLLKRLMPYSSATTLTPGRIASEHPQPVHEDASASYSTTTSPSLSLGLQTTCRALQNLLGVAPPPAALNQQHNNPPYTRPVLTDATPNQAHHRKRRNVTPSPQPPSPPRLPAPPPGGKSENKRSRDRYEEASDLENRMGTAMDWVSSVECHGRPTSPPSQVSNNHCAGTDSNRIRRFSTPKRRRLPGPPSIPFGLERSDFVALEQCGNWFGGRAEE
ncbi:MAG: hypothetical protein LQ340_006362 [Diploschistes diacapsis]|nr:MAG: hypothetical protein LQ340_006362 [Diploschistes diacapsis]